MTIILLIDAYDKDRTYYVDRLKNFLPDCVILEAEDGRTGLDLYNSLGESIASSPSFSFLICLDSNC
jgi:hypothetical protein